MVKVPYTVRQEVGIAREGAAIQQIDTRGLDQAANRMGSAIAGFGEDVGRGLNSLGVTYRERQEKSMNFDAERRFQQYNGQLDTEYQNIVRGSAQNGEGLPETTSKMFDTQTTSFVNTLPPEVREKFAPRVEALKQRYAFNSINEKFKLQDQFSKTTLNDSFQEAIKGVAADPSTTDARVRALGALIQSSTLPEAEKQGMAKLALEGLRLARARRDAQDSPEIVAGAVGGIKGALKQRESTNNPRAENQFGYAGFYQFGAPRLETLGLYKAGAGEDMKGWSKSSKTAPGKWSGEFNIPGFPEIKTKEQFLASPAAQEKAWEVHDTKMTQEAQAYSQFIGKEHRGIPITLEGIKAGLHLGGSGGVSEFFAGRDSVDANKTSVASYIRMGAGVTDAPRRYAGVPLEKLERAVDDGVREKTQAVNAANAQQEVYVKKQFDSLMLGIDRGVAGATEIASARQQGWLDDGRTRQAENLLDTISKKTEDLRVAQGKMANPEHQWNPLSPEDKKSVNLLSEAAGKLMKPAERMNYDLDVWTRTGVASEGMMRDIAGGLVSNDPKKIQASANVAANMLRNNPNAFAGAAESDRVTKAAVDFLYANAEGKSAEVAAAEIAKANDPIEKAKATPNTQAAQDYEKELKKQNVLGKLNPGFGTRLWASLPFTDGSGVAKSIRPDQAGMVESYYREFALEEFKISGDKKKAENFAAFKISQQFGIDRHGQFSRFPPEKAPGYQAINGSKNWLYEQAANDIIAATNKMVKAEDVRFMPSFGGNGGVSTADAFLNGVPVPYHVQFKVNDNGFERWDTLRVPGTGRDRAWVGSYDRYVELSGKPAAPKGSVTNVLEGARDLGRSLGNAIRPAPTYSTGGQM